MESKQKAPMPSNFIKKGCKALKLDVDGSVIGIGRKADEFQMRHMAGRPSITMAAFLYLTLPINSIKNGLLRTRSQEEICQAFGCTDTALRHRVEFVKERS